MRAGPAFRPFASRGRRAVAAILVTFALFSAVSVALSIWATARSQYRASVLEVAARQRTLSERYLREVLLAQQGEKGDPAYVGAMLDQSARALLDGGTAAAVNGDDDETRLSAASGKEDPRAARPGAQADPRPARDRRGLRGRTAAARGPADGG